MIHYSCDLCKRPLDPEDDLRYVVKLEVYAACDPMEMDDTDDDRDNLQEIHEILEQLDDAADPRIGDGDVGAARAAISATDASATIHSLIALANRPGVPDRDRLLDQADALVSSMEGWERVVSLCELAATDQPRRPKLLEAAFAELSTLEYRSGLAPAAKLAMQSPED